MSESTTDIKAIAADALLQAEAILNHYLPGGKHSGREYECGALTGGNGNSCKVNTTSGMWSDFATGEKGGDLVALVAAILKCSQLDAAKELADFIGHTSTCTAPPKSVKKEIWTPIVPVPADAPAAPTRHYQHGEPVAVSPYPDQSGQLIQLVHRYEFPPDKPGEKNRKQFSPLTFCRNVSTWQTSWRFQALPDFRPLYGLDRLTNAEKLALVVEGEKACEAARRKLGNRIKVLTWSGGSNAVSKTDWTPLKGFRICVWPDADAPGHKAALAVVDAAMKAGAESVKLVLPPVGVREGFDLADAEAEGWTVGQVLQYLKDSVTPDEFRKLQTETPETDVFAVVDDSPKKPTLPQIKTMADLINTTFAAIRWVIFGLLPEGLAILSGPPKIGKSWMVMNLCIAVSMGGYVFGKFKVEIGEVLLLSLEDNERRLKGRLIKCLNGVSAALSNYHATTSWKRLDQGGLDDLANWLDLHPACKLVVIDTMQKIKAHPKRKGGTCYENDYDCYGDLQRLALQHRCCILVIHHNRKSDSKNDDDPLEQISGSTGVTGSMDTILMLKRPRGATGAVLTATGRDISEAEYAMQFDGTLGQWVVAGQVAEITMREGSQSSLILSFMKNHAGRVLSAQDIYEGLNEQIKIETLKRELGRLTEKNIIQRDKGKYAFYTSIVSLVSQTQELPNISSTYTSADKCPSSVLNCPASVPKHIKDTKDTQDTITTKDTKDIYPTYTEDDFMGVI